MRNKIWLFIALVLISLGAQAQMPPTDLSKIKVSELSDQQIQDFVNQGKARGYSVEDGEKLALQMGLPPAEALLLKERLSKLQSNDSTKSSKIIKSNLGPSKPVVRRYSSVVDPNQPIEPDTLEVVEDSVEVVDTTEMQLYGRSFFKKANVKLMIQATDARAPESYVLGPGDELVVSVFGTSYANDLLLIDEKGMARVRAMGNIYLAGLTIDQARKLIRAKWGQYYNLNSNQLEISLTYSRVIRVNIVGEVEKPGTYELSALNSVFNALLVAQGPNKEGSLRKIEVIRAGKVVHTFDTYTYLTGTSQTPAFSLADNDYVVVQPLGKVVKLEGAVRRPMYYEMKQGEGIAELFRYAGGLKGSAFTGSIQRNTFVNGAREVIEYTYTKGNALTDTVSDGDEIVVREMPDELRNMLEVKGAVNQPGKFSFKEGMRVSTLVQQAGGLKPEAFGQRAFLSRKDSNETRRTLPLVLDQLLADTSSAENIRLKANDQLIVVSKRDFLDTTDVRVIGAIRKPGDFPYEVGMTLADILLQAGGLKQEADPKRIEVVRLGLFESESKDARVYHLSFELVDGQISVEAKKFVLLPYDRVYVRTLSDFLEPQSVVLEGEFNYPGTYALLSRDERVSDIIQRAGGLKVHAFPEAARFFRLTAPGGQVLIDLVKILNSNNKSYDYRLRDGDSLIVPQQIPYISIQGPGVQYLTTTGMVAVNAPYRKGMRANHYIDDFGDGFSDNAARRRVFVVAANDKVSRTKNILGFIRIYPKVTMGATVYVPEKDAAKEKRQKGDPVNWNRVIENGTIKLTGIATLYILIRQISL